MTCRRKQGFVYCKHMVFCMYSRLRCYAPVPRSFPGMLPQYQSAHMGLGVYVGTQEHQHADDVSRAPRGRQVQHSHAFLQSMVPHHIRQNISPQKPQLLVHARTLRRQKVGKATKPSHCMVQLLSVARSGNASFLMSGKNGHSWCLSGQHHVNSSCSTQAFVWRARHLRVGVKLTAL